MLARDTPGASASQSATFPVYVQEQLRRLGEKEAELRRDPMRAVASAVGRVPQHCASLRECADVVEASVLALGVSAAHTLISSLNEVRLGLEEVKLCWTALQSRNEELSRQRGETMSAMSNSYAALLDKSVRTEKELKQFVAERDRKDAALDKAVEYVQCVVAERAAWQQTHGFNAAELPLETRTFSGQCTTALSSLYAARDALKTAPAGALGTGGSPTTATATNSTGTHEGSAPFSSARAPINRGENAPTSPGPRPTAGSTRVDTVSNVQNAHLFAASASARRPHVSSVDEQHTLSARWRSIQDARHTTFAPSTRLRYIPPAEEVEMLREVLAMGVGSSVLMRDLAAQRETFARLQHRVQSQWAEGRQTLQSLKRELAALKTHMRSLLDQGIPFVYYRQELVRQLNAQVESEVQRRLRRAGRSPSPGATHGHRDTIPDMRNSHFSDSNPAESRADTAEDAASVDVFTNQLPHFAQRASSGGGARGFVFPPRQSDAAELGDDAGAGWSDRAADGHRNHRRDSVGTLSPTL